MSVDPNKVKSVFLKAVEVCEPGNWTEFLKEACAGDNELRRRVEVLLGAHLGEDSLFDDQAGPSPTVESPITEKPGTQIGPYKLLQQIGEGGMGVVYMAEQKEPVKRRVALKIIKPGMDTRQVIARFEAERQALAMMDHPNIAKVLDAGQAESGRPYFVMELVNGISITQYCDEQHLTPKERLELFVAICQAVQHAHQKAIIHRDLKPSNILVAEYDHQAVPKIIDFGVAKATSQTLTEKTIFTQLGQIVGTPEYMSPEQAKRNQLDVDTRSDIYSLGVVLYELLAGETPFDRERLRLAAFDEMLRIIREEEPSKPSTKVSSSQSLPSIAANRRIEPAKLGSMIRGELDWIVLKAMEKDRGRRYETASKFAEDVQHYLNDEAVVACPPSRAYRFRKCARRNKAAILTAVVVFLTLLIGAVGTTWQAVVAMNERDRAVKAETLARTRYEESEKQRKRADAEAENARTEAATAEAVTDFVTEDLLAEGRSNDAPNQVPTVRDLLDRATERIEGRFENQPLVEAAIRQTLGRSYLSLPEFELAYQHLTWTSDTYCRLKGAEAPDTLSSLEYLASAAQKRHPTEAEDILRRVLECRQRKLGAAHIDTVRTMCRLAGVLYGQRRVAEADELVNTAIAFGRESLEPRRQDYLDLRTKLAGMMCGQARFAEAERLNDEVLVARLEILGVDHPETRRNLRLRASLLAEQGEFEEAENLCRDLLDAARKVNGTDHDETRWAMKGLARILKKRGKHDEAKDLLREEMAIRRRVAPDMPIRWYDVFPLIDLLILTGNPEEAEKLIYEVLDWTTRLNPAFTDERAAKTFLAHLFQEQRRFEEAEEIYRDFLAYQQRIGHVDNGWTLRVITSLAGVVAKQNRPAEAVAIYRDAYDLSLRVLGPQHPQTEKYATILAIHCTNRSWRLATAADTSERDPKKAVELAQEAIDVNPKENANDLNNLGVALYRNDEWQAAIDAFAKADSMIEGGDRAHRMFYAMAHWQNGDKERARELYVKGAAWIAQQQKENEDQRRFRDEAEQLMEITAEDRERLIEEHRAGEKAAGTRKTEASEAGETTPTR